MSLIVDLFLIFPSLFIVVAYVEEKLNIMVMKKNREMVMVMKKKKGEGREKRGEGREGRNILLLIVRPTFSKLIEVGSLGTLL